MNTSLILQYSTAFKKCAEEGPYRDAFMNVMNRANEIIQRVLSDNKEYYSKEYFGGQPFSVEVVDGNPSTSEIFISVKPSIQAVEGVERGTNILWFQNELTDKVTPLGVKIKVR